MSATAELRTLFEQYAERGVKHGFDLKDGREYLGWVMEVGEDAILFARAPGPFALDPPDEWISMDAIDLASLSYWDEDQREWRAFP